MEHVEPFLKQVVRKYYFDNKIEDCCFIFPNRRSMTFFRKYLVDEVISSSAVRPMIVPEMITENDFFSTAGGMRTADRITLLVELYGCYKALNPKAETLDEFIFWGDVLLADFNDVDKHLVDPRQIYTNVSDLKSIQSDWSFLTPEQKEAITNLCRHFKGIDPQSDGGPDNVKQSFLQIWNILGQLYFSFRDRLRKKGLAYEGMAYRSVAEAVEGEMPVVDVLAGPFPNVKKFVFVGLNVPNSCEKAVMKKMKNAGIAEFCWDYSGKMISDPLNKSSLFMSENLREFPQVYSWDEVGEHVPQVKVVSVPSGVGQVKVASRILQEGCTDSGKEGRERTDKDSFAKIDMDNCAVVLPDEQLLIPLLNSIPTDIGKINVTMGRSMSSSVIYALMKDISSMQLHMRKRSGGWTFYHRQVWAVFSNGVFIKAADKQCLKKVREIKEEAQIYIPQERFQGDGLMELIFRPAVTDPQSADLDQIHALVGYLKEVVAGIAARLKAPEEDDAAELAGNDAVEDGRVSEIANMTLGFAKEWYCEVTRLDAMNLSVLPSTWLSLLDGVVAPMTVPFKGEPLKGLQIMGPLETRLLDFDDLIILSANEGTFPSRNVGTSFIPPELRHSFGLPTYEYQDAVWAYYFYRMISRASRVWMVYDSRAEGLHTGEESRYIKQLEMHFKLPVERFVAQAAIGRSPGVEEIKKTPEDVEKIRSVKMSATTVQNYLSCPAKFYYSKVKGLTSEDEISEIMDAGTIGNVFHKTMQALYSGEEAMKAESTGKGNPIVKSPDRLRKVDRQYIKNWIGRKDEIRKKVKSLIAEEMNSDEVSGRSLVVAEVIVNYVLKTLRRDEELLEDMGADAFTIEGLELYYEVDFHGFTFNGFIDRLDSPRPGMLRVCDYKTGKVLEEDLNITDETAGSTAELVFGGDNSKRPKIALQIFIYDMLLKEPDSPGFDTRGGSGPRKRAANETVFNSIYQTSSMFVSKIPVNQMNETFYGLMEEKLTETLDEMVDLNVPFSRTEDARICEYCDFKKICGR